MNESFLKEQAARCMAENADKFTKIRLLDLAASYDARLLQPQLSRAMRLITLPSDARPVDQL